VTLGRLDLGGPRTDAPGRGARVDSPRSGGGARSYGEARRGAADLERDYLRLADRGLSGNAFEAARVARMDSPYPPSLRRHSLR
jgi:hypothetical protein